MITPLPRGTAIDSSRLQSWIRRFGSYWMAVTSIEIEDWLAQFQGQHKDLAARILDSVHFVPRSQQSTIFKDQLSALPGWHIDPKKRKGKWIFVPFSGSSGSSGDSMLHVFRAANSLRGKGGDELFKYKVELPSEDLGTDDNVVFVDDFAGTGDQVCGQWSETIRMLVPNEPNKFLLLCACSINARRRIESETDLLVYAGIELKESDNVFSTKCTHFSQSEKTTLLDYCKRANKLLPKGYGECGHLLVFSHDCPNNSIPVLHAKNGKWTGLFLRNL